MQMLKVKQTFKENFDLALNPAGLWKFTEQGKKPVNAFRPDDSSWDSFPKDNMAKFQLSRLIALHSKMVVIDVDGFEISKLYELFPTLKNTFYTITTRPDKRHYYINTPEKLPVGRFIKVGGKELDILTNGIVFEGHNAGNKDTQYSINNQSVKTLTTKEYEVLSGWVNDRSQTNNRSNNSKPAYFINSTMSKLVIKYLNAKKKLALKDRNLLFKNIVPKHLLEVDTKKIQLPELSHATINGIAFILFYNQALDTRDSLAFLEKLLVKEYSVNLNSSQTRQHLYQSILPTLPQHEAITAEEVALTKKIEATDKGGGFGLVKFMSNMGILYLMVDVTTLKPRALDEDNLFLTKTSLQEILDLDNAEFKDLSRVVPMVKLTNNPFKPQIYWDSDSHIDCYNLAKQSIYQEQMLESETLKSTNIFNKLVNSYFDNKADFYWHWLAHCMFSDKPPSTVMACVSSEDAEAGTGKTSLTSSLPQRLIYAAQSIDEQALTTGWGQIFRGKRLITINDAKSPTLWRDKIYPIVRDESTGGQRRFRNMKFGGFVETTESVAFGISANYIPPLDKHDRRMFIALPQQIYGQTNKLKPAEAKKLNQLLEHSGLDEYHTEVQEVANYISYLYNNEKDKYHTELYITAPITEGRTMAIQAEKGYGKQLLYMLENDYRQLPMMVHEPDGLVQTPIKSEKDIIAMILLQYNSRQKKTFLPWKSVSDILLCIQSEGATPKNAPNALANALGIETNSFVKNISQSGKKYRKIENLAKWGLDGTIAKYAANTYVSLEISDNALAWYKMRYSELEAGVE